ncbi:MAG TPA: NTP transferase domain-containing protein [Bacteroidota bacterium]|nr:NTP transferase domain-containing protein [Bacteroidota bacterium]
MKQKDAEPGLAVVILAAGKGTRMKDPGISKVMSEIGGKPMVAYVVELARSVDAERILLVVGWKKESIIGYFGSADPHLAFVSQDTQLGTGHAVQQTAGALSDFGGNILVLSGDVPLLTEKTVRALLGYHRATGAVATILTAEVAEPTGYGRIVRNRDESVMRIAEEKDASAQEKKITEINSGIYVFSNKELFEALGEITPENTQKEYYLPDVFGIFRRKGLLVSAVKCLDPAEVAGINDLSQLESARVVMQGRGGGAAG